MLTKTKLNLSYSVNGNYPSPYYSSEDKMFWNFNQYWLLDPQNQNSYSYARNNPIMGKDPSGLFVMSSGLIEKWDTLNSISVAINKKYSTSYTASSLAKLNGIKNINNIIAGAYLRFDRGTSPTKINFSSDVKSGSFFNYQYNALTYVMSLAGTSSAGVSSTFRTPERQAEVMKSNFSNAIAQGKEPTRYGPNGKSIMNLYPDVGAMTNKINELGPCKVSLHICTPVVGSKSAFDVNPSSISNKNAFTNAANQAVNEGVMLKFRQPPEDPFSYHFEFMVPEFYDDVAY